MQPDLRGRAVTLAVHERVGVAEAPAAAVARGAHRSRSFKDLLPELEIRSDRSPGAPIEIEVAELDSVARIDPVAHPADEAQVAVVETEVPLQIEPRTHLPAPASGSRDRIDIGPESTHGNGHFVAAAEVRPEHLRV